MAYKPSKTNFALNTYEHVVVTIRQGMVGIVPKLILPAIFVIGPFFFLFLLFSHGTTGVVLFISLLIFGIVLVSRRLYLWHAQAFIITNQRIIDVDRRGLFKQIISSASLNHITDVYYESIGLWQTVSKSGNIIVILNDGKTKFEFKNVSYPERTLQIIHDLHKKHSAEFDGESSTAQELVKLVKKIKSGLGEEKFHELIADDSKPK